MAGVHSVLIVDPYGLPCSVSVIICQLTKRGSEIKLTIIPSKHNVGKGLLLVKGTFSGSLECPLYTGLTIMVKTYLLMG
jgi:hypothetical protein